MSVLLKTSTHYYINKLFQFIKKKLAGQKKNIFLELRDTFILSCEENKISYCSSLGYSQTLSGPGSCECPRATEPDSTAAEGIAETAAMGPGATAAKAATRAGAGRGTCTGWMRGSEEVWWRRGAGEAWWGPRWGRRLGWGEPWCTGACINPAGVT